MIKMSNGNILELGSIAEGSVFIGLSIFTTYKSVDYASLGDYFAEVNLAHITDGSVISGTRLGLSGMLPKFIANYLNG